MVGRRLSIKPVARTCRWAGPVMMTSLAVAVVGSVYKQCVDCTTMTHKHRLLRHRHYVTTVMTSLRLATASVSPMRRGLLIALWVVCVSPTRPTSNDREKKCNRPIGSWMSVDKVKVLAVAIRVAVGVSL